MKIAVTYCNGEVFQHFGHTQAFKLYDITDTKVTSSSIVPTMGSGHGALAGFLASLDADILICGGIGGGAVNAVKNAGIKLYAGVSGDCDKAVEMYLKGELKQDTMPNCSHHGSGHNCGNHSCS